MASEHVNTETVAAPHPTCMESVNRVAKLPVVESAIGVATSIYEKVKDYNSVTNWTLSTAESTVTKAVEVGKPVVTPVIRNLEGPIKKVDDVLCTGLDFVETKVPAVKLPPGEIYTQTKDYINSTMTPAVETAKSYAETAKSYAETAKDIVEPAVQTAKNAVEPLVQPTMETIHAIAENVHHRVDEYLHRCHCDKNGDEHSATECQDCKNMRQQNGKSENN